MNRAKFLPRFCFWLTAALTLIGVCLRSIAMLTCFDGQIGYFNNGILPILAEALYPAIILAAVAMICLIPANTLPTELTQPYRLPTSLMTGCVLAAFTFIGLILFFPTLPKTPTGQQIGDFALRATPIILALPASLYYFFTLRRDGRYPDRLSLVGFLPVLWGAACIAETYTDFNAPMNGPVKITLQMGFIGVMLIMVAELRFRLGKPAPRIALALTSIGTFFCLNGSLPLLVAAFAKQFTNPRQIAYAAVLFFVGLYGGYTLFPFTHASRPAEISSPAEDHSAAENSSPAEETPQENGNPAD